MKNDNINSVFLGIFATLIKGTMTCDYDNDYEGLLAFSN